MSPIGAIALATIFNFEKLCENESETCEKIIEELDTFSEKVDEIGDILNDNIKGRENTNPKELQKLQKYKRKFYKKNYLPLIEKFNEQGLSYTPKKKPSKEEYLLEKHYDTTELESVIKKHYSDIKIYFTITMLRSDVYFNAKKSKKTKKEIYKMLDDFYIFLAKKVVNPYGKIKKDIENGFG